MRIGVVVPTLFTRVEYLVKCLESIRSAGPCHIILLGPDVENNSLGIRHLVDQLIEEPAQGKLSSKISFALNSFPDEIELITWIGDDDLLAPNSLRNLRHEFEKNSELVLIYGACDYVDSKGMKIGRNKSGSWALKIAKVGPFLAPQPGSLFHRKAFESVGGLDESLSLAFDLDLFLALEKEGDVKYIDASLASFRWHNDSLSVAHRRSSVREASFVRMKHASPGLKIFLLLANPIVEVATYLAGILVSIRIGARIKQ